MTGEANRNNGVMWLDAQFMLQGALEAPAQSATTFVPPSNVTDEPMLELIASGLMPHRLTPERDGQIWRFALPEPVELVWLLSRSSTPNEMIGSADKRRLGIPVSRIAVDGWDIPLDGDAFREGWYALESGFRWTNGRAALSLRKPATRVEIELNRHIPLLYKLPPDAAPATAIPADRRRPVSATTLAVVTSAGGPDSALLPVWLRYYGRQVGHAHCYVIAGEDAACDFASANVIRLPAPSLDATKTSRFASAFCTALLERYEHVAYATPAELLVADPRYYPSLPELCAACPHDVITTIGFTVAHLPRDEKALDFAQPLLTQRRWMQADGAFSKPLVTRRPLSWSAGFRHADTPTRFDRLFNFNIAHADRDFALQMQSADTKTRLSELLDARASLPQVARIDLDTDCLDTKRFVQRVMESSWTRDGDTDPFDVIEEQLWEIPARFRALF